MDAAALSLNIDSSSVVKAASDLDRFSASATKAGAASGIPSGSIAKLVATVQSMNSKLSAIVGSLDKMATAQSGAAATAKAMAAANDNAGRAVATADAHVTAYTQHLARLSAAQQNANAHVIAYQNHLRAQPALQGDANAHVLAYRDSLNQVGVGAEKAAASLKFTAREGLNASRQVADIWVTAMMGMNPFMIAVQQGPQLFDILQEKAIVTGTTIGTVFRAAAMSVLAMLAPLLPVIAALALAGAAIAALTKQANNDSGLKKYTTAMGYTKAEVKKLNAVTVTFGDTTKAVFQVGMRGALAAMGLSTKDMAKTWKSFLDGLITGTRATLAGVYALFAGTRAYLSEVGKGGILGIGKMLIGQGDPDLLKKTYGKEYANAQAGMDAIVKQAQKNAQGRQNEMAKGFYDAPKTPKGPKAFTFADMMKDADKTRNDLNTQAAQIGLYGEALARVTYEQELLNKASENSLNLSGPQRSAVAGIAAELAKLAEANRLATFREETKQAALEQFRALSDAAAQVGFYGRDLAALRLEQEMLNKAVADHITLTDNDREVIRNAAGTLADKEYGNTRAASREENSRYHNEQIRQLEAERGAINLTGAALISYGYQQDLINKALQAGVELKDIDVAKTQRQGDAYAALRFEIDQQAKVVAGAREVTKSFFSDWINAARDGGNALKEFAEVTINSLNRVIDKLLDKTLDGFLDSMFSGGAGDFFSKLFGGKTPAAGPVGVPKVTVPNALGGVYGSPQRFANGAAFTNSIVNTPTLFRFANGGALGEMGEAGPEAIMPLKRGPNGALGVQAHSGGRPSIRMGDIINTYKLDGAIGADGIAQMVRQGGEATYNQVKRDLQNLLTQLDQDGAFAS